MVTDNLFEFLDVIQSLPLKAKVQNILDMSVKDDRVHDVLNADVVIKYYTKMYEHYEKNPQDFLFPNREWLRESLKRLKVDLSNVFDKCANVDHIKREEVIVLFILLWGNMVIQNPIRIEVIKDPYDLFYIWTKNRVFIARPTEVHYLQDGDRRVLDRLGKSYGWFTGVHHFSIGLKGAVEYHYSSPDDITNIDGAYNKPHGSVTKLRSNFKGFSFGRSDKNSVRYMMNWAQDRTDKLLTELADNFLEEKHRSRNIARNTKFVVREMTGMPNKDYKAFLKKFKEKEVMRYDETSQCFEDILKISSLEIDHEVILEAVDVYNRNVYYLNKALLKLKEKLNEEKNE